MNGIFFYQRENRIESYVGEALLDELDGEHVILHAELHQFLRVAAEGEELDAVAGHEIAEALCDAVNIIAKREGENVCVCFAYREWRCGRGGPRAAVPKQRR